MLIVGFIQNLKDVHVVLEKKVSHTNNLLIKHPDICIEWNYDRNIKTPEEYSYCNREKVWWKCQNGHEWESRIDARTNQKQGCPCCSGRNATHDDNFELKYPALCKEWDFSLNDVKPNEIKCHTSKYIWWKCLICNKNWRTTPGHRIEGTGCPYCQKIQLIDGTSWDSISEAYIYLQYKLNNYIMEFHKKYPNSKKICDIYLPNENKYIEITGYHNRTANNKRYYRYLRNIVLKRRICRNNNLNFEFVKVRLTRDQISYVRSQMIQYK